MRTSFKLLGAGVALAALAVPAMAADPVITPTLRAEKAYFHCNGPTKVNNVNLVAEGPPTWNTTKPSASVQTGAGCGFADAGPLGGTNQENIYDAAFGGTFTGNLDALTVRLHDINVGPSRSSNTATVSVRLTIDGHSAYGMTTAAPPAPAAVTISNVPLIASSTGITSELVFSLSKLGFKFEDGDGAEEHTVLLTVDVQSEVVSGIVMDTTETQSGIDFNPATLAAKFAAATKPAPKPEPVEE